MSSFGGSPFRLHVGLGEAMAIKELEIRWPSGKTQRFQNLKSDNFYQIAEDAKTPVITQRKRFQFATSKQLHSHH